MIINGRGIGGGGGRGTHGGHGHARRGGPYGDDHDDGDDYHGRDHDDAYRGGVYDGDEYDDEYGEEYDDEYDDYSDGGDGEDGEDGFYDDRHGRVAYSRDSARDSARDGYGEDDYDYDGGHGEHDDDVHAGSRGRTDHARGSAHDAYGRRDGGGDDYDGFGDLLGDQTTPVRRSVGDPSPTHRQVARRRRTAVPKLLAVLLVAAALAGGAIYGVGKVVGKLTGGDSADFPGPGEGNVVVEVAPGATSRDIAGVLAAEGVVASVGAFLDAAAADSRSLSIQPGHYRLRQRMSAAGALDALLDPGANSIYRFTIPEGRTVREVLVELSKRTEVPIEEYLKIIDNPEPLGLPSYATTAEGYLYPATYDLVPDASPADTLKMFVDRFEAEVADLDLERAAPAVGLEPQDVVTVASIIEKEVANAEEFPKVSRVVYNRLNDRTGHFTRLDMDSTTRYATGNFDGPLTMSQLQEQHPYNTRAVAGLPPGAISNPGRSAIEAALRPAQGTWLYFVSLPRSGVTIFATTQEEWDEAEARYRSEGGS